MATSLVVPSLIIAFFLSSVLRLIITLLCLKKEGSFVWEEAARTLDS